jgi:hypothetical protein
MSTMTALRPDESEDGFGPLMDRLNSVIHRLKLAAEDLGEVAETPAEEHHSAAFVVVEVTKELVKLHRDIEDWAIRYFPATYWDQLEPLPHERR